MCDTSLNPHHHQHTAFNNAVDAFSFSPFHLLRNCNRLILPSTDMRAYGNNNDLSSNNNHEVSPLATNLSNTQIKRSRGFFCSNLINISSSCSSPLVDVLETATLNEEENIHMTPSNSPPTLEEDHDSNEMSINLDSEDPSTVMCRRENMHNDFNKITNTTNISTGYIRRTPNLKHPLTMTSPKINVTSCRSENDKSIPVLPCFESISSSPHLRQPINEYCHPPLIELNRIGRGISIEGGLNGSSSILPGILQRRPRGEKRPIPDDQKDEKYFERRKRNNEAAKKSRDARKIREDRIAFRAVLLEQENSILRAQVIALHDELQTLRQLMSIAAAPAPRVITSK